MDLQECWQKEKRDTDTHIVKNIREFLKYHKNLKGGTLHSTLAAAVEAVETAVMNHVVKSFLQSSESQIALITGMGGRTIACLKFVKKQL
jgi:hypothetical protein